MTKDEARKWIEEKVWEVTDINTSVLPCEEVVVHFRNTPTDQPILIEALNDFLTNQQLTSPEQAGSAAYLVANFGARGLLDLLFSKLTAGEEPDEFCVRIAMNAIRNFRAFDSDQDDVEGQKASDFLPFLIDRLREKGHADLAYEIISQFYPRDMISYFLWALAHHSNDVPLVQKMVTTLYFDPRKETPRSFALDVIRDLWSLVELAVEAHPQIPKEVKARFPRIEGLRRELEAKLDANAQRMYELETRIADHTAQVEQLEEKLKEREEQLNRMDRTIDELAEAHNWTKGVIRDLKEKQRLNEEQILYLQKQLSERDRLLKEARAALSIREEELKEKNRQIRSLAEAKEQASRTIKNLQSNLEAQVKRINELEAALKSAQGSQKSPA